MSKSQCIDFLYIWNEYFQIISNYPEGYPIKTTQLLLTKSIVNLFFVYSCLSDKVSFVMITDLKILCTDFIVCFYSIQWHNCPRLVSMVPTICFQPTSIYVPVSYHEPLVMALCKNMLIFSFKSICICHLRPFILLYNVLKVHYKLWRWSDIHSTISKWT